MTEEFITSELGALKGLALNLERDLQQHVEATAPWVGVNGQAAFRLERLEQAFNALLNGLEATPPAEGAKAAVQRAREVMQFVRPA